MDYPQSDEPAEPAEVYEYLPWAELSVPVPARKPWVVYLIAGAIVVGAVGALAARSTRSTSYPAAAIEATTVPLEAVVTLPPSPPTSHQELLSEADLLAATPGLGEIAAIARAEWFVIDYFSSGGDPSSSREVLEALPERSRLPEPAGPASSTYVDWAASSRIEALGNERFRSTVLFRLLVADDAGSYVRLPVQAVDVVVAVDPAGGTRVLDLPIPVPIPAGPAAAAWEDPSDEVPERIVTVALQLAESWGTEPTLIEAAQRTGGWRVVVGVADEGGVRWPLTVFLTDDGDPAPGA